MAGMNQPPYGGYGAPPPPGGYGGTPSQYGAPPAPYGPPGAYGGSPSFIPPGPQPPKKSKALFFVLGGALLVLLIGLVAGLAVFLAGRSKSVALPVDVKLLPTNTSEISTQVIESTRETDEKVKRAYVASELGSELCKPGVGNPARRIEGLGSGSTKAAKELFFQKKNIDDIRSLLECGSVLGESLEKPYQAVITVEGVDGKRNQRIGVGHFNITELPKKHGYTPFSYKGIAGFCRTTGDDRASLGLAAPAPGVCDDTTFGAFPQSTTWFLGTKESLETMASSVKSPKDDLNARLSALKDAANETQGLPSVRVTAQPKSSRDFFQSPCMFGATNSAAGFTAFLDGCFPSKGQEKTLESIDAKVKAAAFETDNDPVKAGSFVGNLVFVARDDDAAKSVESDVKDVVGEWRNTLEQNEAKLTLQSNELAFSGRQKRFAGIVDTYLKALKNSKVTRKGRTIRVSYKEALSKADLVAAAEADKSSLDKKQATADILDAIQAKRPVPQPSLAKLVGPAWATFLTGPAPAEAPSAVKAPMSTEECRKLQSRIAPFNSNNFFTTDARLMFFSHKFATCGVRNPEVDPIQAGCLASFKSASEYARCASADLGAVIPPGQPPETDFGDRRKK
ncbi:MAG: hypothetical protein JWP97_6605 [Labilithrix sp.]|nr:hypothetical protein [Labilithrix sp.]